MELEYTLHLFVYMSLDEPCVKYSNCEKRHLHMRTFVLFLIATRVVVVLNTIDISIFLHHDKLSQLRFISLNLTNPKRP